MNSHVHEAFYDPRQQTVSSSCLSPICLHLHQSSPAESDELRFSDSIHGTRQGDNITLPIVREHLPREATDSQLLPFMKLLGKESVGVYTAPNAFRCILNSWLRAIKGKYIQ